MYEQTYRRLEKLKATFDQLVISNQKMAKKIREQEQYISSTHEREVARERVLASLKDNNLDWLKYVKEIHLAPEPDLGLVGQAEEIKEDGEGIPPPT